MKKRFLAAMLAMGAATVCLAEESEAPGHGAATRHAEVATSAKHAESHEAEGHPTLSANPAWARSVIGLIAALFAAAIPIGILVRANMPEQAQPTHDDHGAGHEEHGHH